MLKNITLSAEDDLIAEARQKAQKQKKTLNALFREWLLQYIHRSSKTSEYRKLMRKLEHIHASGPYSRDEMNERK